ncbi:bile acid:sodium symporter family protein [Fredinandcohnia sp. 179-A 10B2 NHS]|uniref:bile acid:sodium symporter family protein n=1 Tax=Fredinandcohnia sp. 179-A 10B2 NHS TaxID=3235176 RepID=UPI00399FA6E2
MLTTLNKQLEKWLPFLTPASVVTGVLLSTFLLSLDVIVPWVFAIMTFSGAINSSFKSLQHTISHPFPILVALFILHILMPTWAWIVGHITFPEDSLTVTGFILGVVIPTGITSFIWVAMRKGNTALTLSVIIIDTMLSPFIVPASMTIFVGANVEIDILNMMKGLFFMIVIPSILGMVVNHIMKSETRTTFSTWLSPVSKLGIVFVVVINSAEIAPYLREVNLKLLAIAVVVFCIAFSGYLFAYLIGKLLKFEQQNLVCLIFTGGMRNIGAGVVIAVSFFPPQTAVPVVIAMLFQQMLASLYSYFIVKFEKGNKEQSYENII